MNAACDVRSFISAAPVQVKRPDRVTTLEVATLEGHAHPASWINAIPKIKPPVVAVSRGVTRSLAPFLEAFSAALRGSIATSRLS